MSKKCGAEGLANFIAEEKKPVKNEASIRMFQLKVVLLFILIQLAFIYLVSEVLWPRIMPKLFKNVVEKPGFLPVLGLSVIGHLLL
tara:strand:- start:512 stop:769 length:258 start_codon:yes stop_codon:yes gene_type:complete